MMSFFSLWPACLSVRLGALRQSKAGKEPNADAYEGGARWERNLGLEASAEEEEEEEDFQEFLDNKAGQEAQ